MLYSKRIENVLLVMVFGMGVMYYGVNSTAKGEVVKFFSSCNSEVLCK